MPQLYEPPQALTIISGIFLALGVLFLLLVTIDIVLRRGWKSMMWIMIPVYIINASYMGPLTLYIYWKYGRPTKRSEGMAAPSCHQNNDNPSVNKDETHREEREENHHQHHKDHSSSSRPMLVTVMVGVSHCGAGCVLGDLVGEWLVYGTRPAIHGHAIWPELLIDYAFALLFGILFQYFSIAPMTGAYGLGTVFRAAKADILSLTSFEIGLFGWMVAFQVGIFGYNLPITTWTYWWMMQIGMILGFATALPVNWILIKRGIKVPCA